MTKRNQIILLSALGVVVAGLMLYLLLGRRGGKAQAAAGAADSSAVAKSSAAIDTVADMRLIREYYEKANNGSINSSEGWDKLNDRCLTPLMAERSIADANDYNLFIRGQEVPENFLKTLRVWHIRGDWYMVAWKKDYAPGWEQVPVRLVTDAKGRRKIGYVTPGHLGTAASDTLFYPKVVPMPAQPKSARAFVEAFYCSYFSTWLTIDPGALPARQTLLHQWVDRSSLGKVDHDVYLSTDLPDELMEAVVPDGHWQPRFKVYTTQRSGWFCVRGAYPSLNIAHYAEVEKRGGRYVLTRFQENTPVISGEEESGIVWWPDVQPSFWGGQEAMKTFLSEHLEYPEAARKAGQSAVLDVALMLEKDGTPLFFEVAADPSDAFAAEATRLFGSMPEWSPALVDNGGVRSMVYGTLVFSAPRAGNPTVSFVRRYVEEPEYD